MSIASKSPKKIARIALYIGFLVFPEYRSACSRHDFTQPQLFACLILRKYMNIDYRSISQWLADCSDIRQWLGLGRSPHFTTLQKTERRLMQNWGYNELINHCTSIVYNLSPPGYQVGLTEGYTIDLAAIDSTKFESRHCSRYYISSKNRYGKQIEHTTCTR